MPQGKQRKCVTEEEKYHAWDKEDLIFLGEELVKCVSEAGVWHISEFSERNDRSCSWLYTIRNNHPTVFGPYFQRAKEILGRKMLKQSLEKSPNQWVVKVLMPRLLGIRDEIAEELEREELIKAQAKIKALKKELTHQGEILDYINAQKQLDHVTK